MNRQKSKWRKCLGRTEIRRLEILVLAAISIMRVDSAQWVRHPDPVWTLYATNVGDLQSFILQDGSRVDLNTDSAIKARFMGGQREIVLTHGEAFFSVVHRTNWPFSVRAGGKTINAVGTKFSVRMRAGDETDVLVSEGRIGIEGPSGAAAPNTPSSQAITSFPLIVSAGESIAMNSTTVLARATLSPATLKRRTAWTDGWIWFFNDPLPRAVAEFNRYHREHLVLVDPALASVEIGGRFRSTDLDSFIAALEHSFEIRALSSPVGGAGAPTIYLAGTCVRAQQQCNWPMVQ
jgi:transmembrane sensor